MLSKFAEACELILENNKGDMKSLRSELTDKFNLKPVNFSDMTILPDGTVRMRVVAPGNEQLADDVFFVDVKNRKFTVNGLKNQNQLATDVEQVIDFITPDKNDSEDIPPEEPEQENPARDDNEPEPEPEQQDKEQDTAPEEEPEQEETPEEEEETQAPDEDEFDDAEKKKREKEKEDENE